MPGEDKRYGGADSGGMLDSKLRTVAVLCLADTDWLSHQLRFTSPAWAGQVPSLPKGALALFRMVGAAHTSV